MILTTVIFAAQDGISRYLGARYDVLTVVTIRYWFFAAFVVVLAAAKGGGVARVVRTRQPVLQIFRGVLLAVEICVTVLSFVLLGLIGTHAIFSMYPLLIAALAGPVLGEYVGWRRGLAILVGLVGVLVILRPGFQVFSPLALIPFVAALLFALYGLLTRLVAREDSAETSFFYTGVVGAVTMTLTVPFFWTPMQGAADWAWMAALCVMGALGHFLLIKAYEVAEAGTIQPFAYFQLVFVTLIALAFFDERPDAWTIAGGALILAAGLYTLIRQARLGTFAGMKRAAAALMLAGLALAGCDRLLPFDLVSDDQVEAMGLQAWDQLRAERPPSDAPALQRELDRIAARLLAAAGGRPEDWEAVVFDGPEVNAFALPGNKIGVFEGMFDVAGSADQLAAVVGHEIGHLAAEHSKERMTAQVVKDLGLRIVYLILRLGDVQYAADIAAALGLGAEYGLVLPYSRGHELEADRLGLELMAEAGYDPAAAVELWRRMEAAAGEGPPGFLSTHPTPAARIEALEEMLPEIGG